MLDYLHTALDGYLRAEGTMLEARMESRLFDACLRAGMGHEEPSAPDWAANVCARDLLEAA